MIAGVCRQPLDAPNGFDDCIDGVNFGYSGFQVVDPQYQNLLTILSAPNAGNWDLRMNRYAVGPRERFDLVVKSFGQKAAYGFKSLANGKYMCSTRASAPLKATCDSITLSNGAAFWAYHNSDDDDFYLMAEATGDYVSVAGDDLGRDPRLGAPRHGVSGSDGVVQLNAGHQAASISGSQIIVATCRVEVSVDASQRYTATIWRRSERCARPCGRRGCRSWSLSGLSPTADWDLLAPGRAPGSP